MELPSLFSSNHPEKEKLAFIGEGLRVVMIYVGLGLAVAIAYQLFFGHREYGAGIGAMISGMGMYRRLLSINGLVTPPPYLVAAGLGSCVAFLGLYTFAQMFLTGTMLRMFLVWPFAFVLGACVVIRIYSELLYPPIK
jgi:hypothetical protein